MTRHTQQCGFTLIEMIVVIVITGIIGGMVAMFIRAPVQGYVDSSNRAEMGDIADIALRRLARDIRTSVPNSVRMPATNCVAAVAAPCYVEFLPTRTGGRYRAAAPGNVLNFGVLDGDFDIVGSPVTFEAGDYIVIGSTQSDGNPPYNTGGTGILRRYTGVAGAQATVTFTSTALPVWAEVPGQRFDVVPGDQQAVTYACLNVGTSGGEGTGTLTRYWAYSFNTTQIVPPGGSTAVLADRVSACEINYDLTSQRHGLVAIRLGITRGGESI
ncbi:MAG: prepilin-type N-terminal cleavage/methylation domain-containing protein, partial [Gallionellaceae bacterium]